MTTADHIKAQLDIAVVVGDYVHLKKVGSRHMGLCPFHSEKTPSFGIKVGEQFYKCFGCDAKGDVIWFIQQIEGVSFASACNLLVERYGVTLPESNNAPIPAMATPDELRQARLWQHGMALWLEDSLVRMKASVTDADFEMHDSPKAAFIQVTTRKQKSIAALGKRPTDLVAAYVEAKQADAAHVAYCVQRARRNIGWWKRLTDRLESATAAMEAA